MEVICTTKKKDEKHDYKCSEARRARLRPRETLHGYRGGKVKLPLSRAPSRLEQRGLSLR